MLGLKISDRTLSTVRAGEDDYVNGDEALARIYSK